MKQLTAVEKIIAEIDNELQTLEGLDGKEITGSRIALEFVKKVAIEAKEMENKTFNQKELSTVDLSRSFVNTLNNNQPFKS